MDFIRENKGIAIILALVIVAGVGYLLFGGSSGSSDSLLTSTQTETTVSPISRELLVTLGDLRSITLDESVFTNPVFISLQDFGTEIPPQPLGRRNPFAPLGTGGPATTGAPQR